MEERNSALLKELQISKNPSFSPNKVLIDEIPLLIMDHGCRSECILQLPPSPLEQYRRLDKFSQHHSRPLDRRTALMALPCQFNDSDPITRLLRLDRRWCPATYRIHDALIESQPSPRNRRVSCAVCLGGCIVCRL